MKRNNKMDEFEQLRHPDERIVQEIAEQFPVLDDAAKDRIETLCERKLSERMNSMTRTNDMTFTTGVEKITRTQWFRPAVTAAACLLIAVGVAGGAMMGGRTPSVNPTPPVNSRNDDPSFATAASTESASKESSEKTQEGTQNATQEDTQAASEQITATESSTSATITATETAAAESQKNTDEPLINGLRISDLRTMFEKNVNCLQYFVTAPRSAKGEALDGNSIYEVNFPEFSSYAELERYVYSTYCDPFADVLLHNFPLNGSVYLDYNGKFCVDTRYALNGISLDGDWSNFEIVNPAAMSEYAITFDVVIPNIHDADKPIGATCIAMLESDGWRLETMYGYEKSEIPTSDQNGSSVNEALHVLVDRAMQISSDYPTKGEALPNTSLYEVDFSEINTDYFWDYASFEELVNETFTPEVAEWVLYHSIYKEINGKLYLDTEKAAYVQGALVEWSVFDVVVDSMTEAESGNTCTFRAIATDDPSIQFPDTALEDRTDYYRAEVVNGLGWRLSEKPDLLK